MSIYGKNYFIMEKYQDASDYKTGKSISGQEIIISKYSNNSEEYVKEQLDHLNKDFNTAKKEFDTSVKKVFIPWLKSEDITYKNYKEHLSLYEISYSYKHMNDKHSPTGKDGYFGEFEFCFNGKTDIGKNSCQASALVILIQNNKVVGTRCYDI